MKNKRKSFPFLPVALLVSILLIAIITLTVKRKNNTAVSSEVAGGISYLEQLEQKDPNQITQIRKDILQKKLDAQRDALVTQLTNGALDPFSLFKDSVIMGDSRVVGFWYYKYLDKGQVLAEAGHTIRNISSQIDTLVSINPSTIYLCYGINDTKLGNWKTAQEYTAEYMKIIQEIQAKLPNATIVVGSIMPARDPAFKRSQNWRNIPEWSATLEKACKENHIIFANCDKLAQDYANLWESDGIHFRSALYPHWMKQLILSKLTGANV